MPAADVHPEMRIAELGEKLSLEASLARHLPHHLHQAIRKSARVRFGCGNLARGVKRGHVSLEECRLEPHGPWVPSGLLLDHRADERAFERIAKRQDARDLNAFAPSCKLRRVRPVRRHQNFQITSRERSSAFPTFAFGPSSRIFT